MGAPKQKWTAEEEAALKAGVIKHGAGKWRTILTDPEFSGILHLRSNVDLKVSVLEESVISLSVFEYLNLINWMVLHFVASDKLEALCLTWLPISKMCCGLLSLVLYYLDRINGEILM